MSDETHAAARTFYAARMFYADNAQQHLDCDRDLLIERCAEYLANQFDITEDSALIIAVHELLSSPAVERRD